MAVPVVPIPAFEPPGLLPPFVGAQTKEGGYAPYRVSLVELVARFGNTSPRMSILDGFLRYRAALHALGLVDGFQWIDGSFTEEIEAMEDRPPGDIDIVTFTVPNPRLTPEAIEALSAGAARQAFKCDAYFVDMRKGGHHLVKKSAYWHGLFSHKKGRGTWKGLLEIDLAPLEDAEALAKLGDGLGRQP